jgi:hypothetical protein
LESLDYKRLGAHWFFNKDTKVCCAYGAVERLKARELGIQYKGDFVRTGLGAGTCVDIVELNDGFVGTEEDRYKYVYDQMLRLAVNAC